MNSPNEDPALLEACREGDPEAFRRLFHAYKDNVYSIALHFSGDESVASDVTQEVFLKVFTRISGFRADSSLKTWLFRLAANACIDAYRKRRRFVPLPEEQDRQGSFSFRGKQEEQVFRRQIRENVKSAVAELSPKLRLPILLRYIEGLSYEEIASALGTSTGTVASRLNRGHRQLARRLSFLRNEVLRETNHA